MRDKGRAVIGSAGRTTDREYFIKHQGNMAAQPVIFQKNRGFNKGGVKYDKSPTVTSSSWENNNKVVEPICVNSKSGRGGDS